MGLRRRLPLPLEFFTAALLAGLSAATAHEKPGALERLFEERLRAVAVVEFALETEAGARRLSANGVAVDGQGLIRLPEDAVPSWAPLERLKEFRVYRPGEREAYEAAYLGSDRVYGWHYARVKDEAFRATLVPLSTYSAASLSIGQSVWGIGIASKELDYTPYFLRAEVATMQPMPNPMGFATYEVASPGSLVFDDDGALAGWAASSLNMERYLTIGGRRYKAHLKKPDQSSVFYLAEFLREAESGPPPDADGEAVPWIGLIGLDTIGDKEADRLELADHVGMSPRGVAPGSPADEAGLQASDVIVSLDGERFRRRAPRRVAVSRFEQEILKRSVGEVVRLGALRDGKPMTFLVPLGRHPKLLRQAKRRYFEEIGLTLREYLIYDAVAQELPYDPGSPAGVVAHFVRAGGPAERAGFRQGDLVTKLNGAPVEGYAQAVRRLEASLDGGVGDDLIASVRRGPETATLRVKLTKEEGAQ